MHAAYRSVLGSSFHLEDTESKEEHTEDRILNGHKTAERLKFTHKNLHWLLEQSLEV